MNKKVIINNLPFSLTEDRIGAIFVGHGEIVDIELIIDPYTGRSRGCGLLEMKSEQDAQQAIVGNHGNGLRTLEGMSL